MHYWHYSLYVLYMHIALFLFMAFVEATKPRIPRPLTIEAGKGPRNVAVVTKPFEACGTKIASFCVCPGVGQQRIPRLACSKWSLGFFSPSHSFALADSAVVTNIVSSTMHSMSTLTIWTMDNERNEALPLQRWHQGSKDLSLF